MADKFLTVEMCGGQIEQMNLLSFSGSHDTAIELYYVDE